MLDRIFSIWYNKVSDDEKEMRLSMKKHFYYAAPFFLTPVVMLLCDLLHQVDIIQMTWWRCLILLTILSFLVGMFSQSPHKFDYILIIIMPLSLFCCMFVLGFLYESDVTSRFDLINGFKTAFQPIAFLFYGSMAMVAFLSSFRKIRIGSKLRRSRD